MSRRLPQSATDCCLFVVGVVTLDERVNWVRRAAGGDDPRGIALQKERPQRAVSVRSKGRR